MSRIIGHYAPWFLATLVGALVVLTLIPAVSTLVPWQVLLALLVVAFLLGLSILAHNRRLCERCIASLPLDAATVAGRYAVRFRVAHLFESRLFALCYLGALVGSSLLYSHPVGRYGWAVAEALARRRLRCPRVSDRPSRMGGAGREAPPPEHPGSGSSG